MPALGHASSHRFLPPCLDREDPQPVRDLRRLKLKRMVKSKHKQIHTSTLGPKVGPEQRLRMAPRCDLLECWNAETALGSGGKHE